MKKLWFGFFCVLAIAILVCFAVYGQYELIPGMALVFIGVSIGFFTKKDSTRKTVPAYFTLFLTAVSTAMVALFTFIIDNFIVHYIWLRYLALAFGVVSIVLYIICYRFMRKKMTDN